MNLRKNARTCPKSRAAMVHRVLEERVPVSVVAENQRTGSAILEAPRGPDSQC